MKLKHKKFSVEAVGSSQPGYLMVREVGQKTKEAIFKELSQLEPNTVLDMDFSSIQYMDVSCANEVGVMVLKRLESGEYPEVFITLINMTEQHIANMDYALRVDKKAVIIQKDEGWEILGEIMESYKAALFKVMELGSATAKELQDAMGYKTVNEASTKLSSLYQQRLIAREPGGGRRYRYISLVQKEAEGLVE